MAKALIFDFDGTLADSFDTLIDIFQALTKQQPKLSRTEIEALRGMTLKNIIAQLRIRAWQLPFLLFKGRRMLAERIDDIRPFAGVPAMLNQLSKHDYKIYIVSTNHKASIERFFWNNNIKNITAIYGNIGLTGKAKVLRALIKREQFNPDDCIYIGDETRDIEAAHKAGIKCIAVTWGFNNAKALRQLKPYTLASTPKQIVNIARKVARDDT